MAIPFGEWLPDQPDFGNSCTVAKNVIPIAGGYKQFLSFSNTITALAARVQGAVAVKETGGGTHIYAGTASGLFQLPAGATAFTDRSKVGGYTCGADERWSFARYAENVFAANISDPIQASMIGASSVFADLSASAPKARHLGVWNSFLVLGNINDTSAGVLRNGLRWSGIDAPSSYPTVGSDSAVQAQSDLRELPEGGAITGIAGGELGGYAICERMIYRSTYVGSPLVFDLQPVEQNRGTRFPGSIIVYGRYVFFLADDGFYLFDGIESQPIGTEKIDSWFLADLDPLHVPRICSAYDPVNKLAIWAYPGSGNSAGNPTKIVIYKQTLKRWSYVETTLEFLLSGLSLGYTLDTLDSIGLALDALPYSLDSYVFQGGVPQLTGFDTSHRFGYFNGSAMAARLTTGEQQLTPGQRSLVTAVTPLITDASGTVTVTHLTRKRLANSSLTSSSAFSMSADGECYGQSDDRYHRFQMDTTGSFGKAMGVDPTFDGSGAY